MHETHKSTRSPWGRLPESFQPERLSTMGMSPGTFQKDLKVPVGRTSTVQKFPAIRALKVLVPFVGQQFFLCIDTYKHSWPVGTTARTLSTRKTFHNGRVARNLSKGSQGARGPNLNCQKISGNTRTVGVDAIRRPTVLRMHLTCTSSQCR